MAKFDEKQMPATKLVSKAQRDRGAGAGAGAGSNGVSGEISLKIVSSEGSVDIGEPQGKAENAPVANSSNQSTNKETPELPESAKKPDLEISSALGERYEVLSLIGTGGMASVYKVHDKALNREFAIKVLNPSLVEDASSLKRFELEAKSASKLTHPNLVAVYDYGVANDGRPFLVMDYLEGTDLAQILETDGFLETERALDIFIHCAEALAHAHSKGIIHRDVKPSNILVDKNANGDYFAKLVDLGIAKVLPSHHTISTNLTQTGDIFGSPLYMSPEQCQGNTQFSTSDIYSMGCVMYETLTGEKPFAAPNPIKTILRHIQDEPVKISSLNYDYGVPKDLEYVIMRCLQKDPAERYQSAYELLHDLQKVQDGKPIQKKNQSNKDEKEERRQRKIKLERIAAIVLVLQVLPWIVMPVLTPGYYLPIFASPVMICLILLLAVWEALGIWIYVSSRQPRSEFQSTLKLFTLVFVFMLPCLLTPIFCPAICTILQAIAPLLGSGMGGS